LPEAAKHSTIWALDDLRGGVEVFRDGAVLRWARTTFAMGNPKQKFGKSRTRKRRANWKTSAPVLAACPRCKKPRLPHTVCDECGYYDGREVIRVAE
jgi:large subunit ribosomal protein L32